VISFPRCRRICTGPYDNFDLLDSHVLPALTRKCHEARIEGRDEVPIWGTGAT